MSIYRHAYIERERRIHSYVRMWLIMYVFVLVSGILGRVAVWIRRECEQTGEGLNRLRLGLCNRCPEGSHVKGCHGHPFKLIIFGGPILRSYIGLRYMSASVRLFSQSGIFACSFRGFA